MEKFFQKYLYWVREHVKKIEKYFPHHHKIAIFFKSKNARLILILIIALAIPLTVLGVQQIQDIREHASNEPLCSGDYVVSPQPALQEGQVTFSLKSGATVDNNINGFGNGVYADTCIQDGPKVTCKVRGSFAASDPTGTIKKSTWFILNGGSTETNLCQYQVQRVKAEPTRGPTKPPPPAGGACTGTITAACDFANKPIFTISWDLRKSTAPCKVDVKAKTGSYTNNQSTKCEDASNIKVSGGQIANGDYQLVLTKKGAQCFTASATANCKSSTGGTPTPTQKPKSSGTPNPTQKPGSGGGTPTPTLKPGQATPTPTKTSGGTGSATCTKTDVHLDKAGSSCTTSGKIRLTGGWDISGTNCKVTLYEDGKVKSTDDTCKNSSWNTSNGLSAGKKYQLKATSDICKTEKLESDTITAKACTAPQCTSTTGNGGVVAGTFNPNCPTPTKGLNF